MSCEIRSRQSSGISNSIYNWLSTIGTIGFKHYRNFEAEPSNKITLTWWTAWPCTGCWFRCWGYCRACPLSWRGAGPRLGTTGRPGSRTWSWARTSYSSERREWCRGRWSGKGKKIRSVSFNTYSQTSHLFLKQMALLGFIFLPPYAAAWSERWHALDWDLWRTLYRLCYSAANL